VLKNWFVSTVDDQLGS
jgi:hypothetical protein